MILTKNISNYNATSFFYKREQPDNSAWGYDPYKRILEKKVRHPYSFLSNNTYSLCEGTICNDFISFSSGHFTLSLDIEIPKDLIRHTKCSFIIPMQEVIEIDEDTFEATYRGMIKFIYSGPDELALIWRLSI